MVSRNKGFGIIGVVLIIVLVGALGFIGYKVYTNNNNESEPTAEKQTVQQEVQPKTSSDDSVKKSKGTIITTGESDFGTMLFDDNNQAIYIWELEESKKAECYDDCAEAWPPVLTNGTPIASGEVNEKLLGTTERTDGTTQVTYNNHPLYYYAHEKPGEVKCHNISTHGGLWWVIQPNGNRAS